MYMCVSHIVGGRKREDRKEQELKELEIYRTDAQM